MSKSNELRMPFAEWLYRMSEKDAPYQARALAVYAVVFKVTANEELARLAGMDTKGLADKTYNKWKSYLSAHGWVIIKQVISGRVRTIEIAPAVDGTPVTFTDLIPRVARKFYGSTPVEVTVMAAVEFTDEIGAPAVEVTDETSQPVEVTVGRQVEVTDEPSSPLRARAESNYINKTNIYQEDREEEKDRGSGGKEEKPDLEAQEFATPKVALEAFQLYNEMALKVGLPQARTLTPQRRKNLLARLREHGGIDAWKTALANVEKSAFLQGSNDRGWRADLDFLIQASRFTKVVEGTYGNGAHASTQDRPRVTDQDRIAEIMRELEQEDHQKKPTRGAWHEQY